MDDSRTAIKTPVVYIFNHAGEELTSSLGVNGLSVVELKYTYDDEDDDICELKLRAESPGVLDGTTITYGSRLLVQWGYIGGPLSQRALVVVRDIQTKYGNNVIWVSLECTDYTTYLKTARGDDAEEYSILEYLENKCTTERGFSYKVVIKQFGDVVYKQGKIKKGSEDEGWGATRLAWYFNFDPFKDGFQLKLKKVPTKEGNSKVPSSGELYSNIKPELEQFLLKKRNFTDANRSPYQVLSDIFRYAPFGPWYVSGRGDTIKIHNRNIFDRAFLDLNYQQEPGLLQDITITSKYEAFEQRTVSSPHLNPEDKIAYYEDVYIKELQDVKSIDKILLNQVMTEKQKKEELKKFISLFRASKDYRVERMMAFSGYQGAFVQGNIRTRDPNDLTGDNFQQTYGSEDIPLHGGDTLQHGVMKDFGPEGLIYDPNYTPEWQNVAPFFVYLLPGATIDETRDMMDNIARELEMDKVEAKMIIEGDPRIMSEAVVRVGNIQKIHVGEYYLKKVEHTVTAKGYKVTMDAFKVMTKPSILGISHQTVPSKTDEKSGFREDYPKLNQPSVTGKEDGAEVINRYHREQALFKNWGLLIKLEGSTWGGQPGFTIAVLEDYVKSKDEVSVDKLVDEIVAAQVIKDPRPNTEDR